MALSLNFSEISFLLAVLSIILLMTTEYIRSYSSNNYLIVENKRLKRLALSTSFLFFLSAAIMLMEMLLSIIY